jgi:hypothetical protein
VVESQLPKLLVAGSIPVSRSSSFPSRQATRVGAAGRLLTSADPQLGEISRWQLEYLAPPPTKALPFRSNGGRRGTSHRLHAARPLLTADPITTRLELLQRTTARTFKPVSVTRKPVRNLVRSGIRRSGGRAADGDHDIRQSVDQREFHDRHALTGSSSLTSLGEISGKPPLKRPGRARSRRQWAFNANGLPNSQAKGGLR